MADKKSKQSATPVLIAIAVAVVGVTGLYVMDHGPWNTTKQKNGAAIEATAVAADAAGATITPTPPNSTLEPVATGTTSSQPAERPRT